jgi:hypothetical protein
MVVPRDIHARKYYRVAKQRLEEGELVLVKLDRPSAAVYLLGYAIECILKALLIELAPTNERDETRRALKEDFGHNLRRLRAGVVQRGVAVPRPILSQLLFVSSWSPELRYEPGPGDRREAERFLAATKDIVIWADGSI